MIAAPVGGQNIYLVASDTLTVDCCLFGEIYGNYTHSSSELENVLPPKHFLCRWRSCLCLCFLMASHGKPVMFLMIERDDETFVDVVLHVNSGND